MKPRLSRQSSLLRRVNQRLLVVLLLMTGALSVLWALSTPVPIGMEGRAWGNYHPDESSHVAVVLFIAEHAALPPYRIPYDTSVHPPLYHLAAGAIVATMRPFVGDAGGLRAVRLLTALCGVGTVWLIYRAGRHLMPRQTALFAATLVALVPMRASLGGAINNENLAMLGATGALATIVGAIVTGTRGSAARCGKSENGFSTKRTLLLALWITVGVGSKLTCLGLFPATFLALALAARQRGDSRSVWIKQILIILGIPALFLGWWFVRNQVLYGDIFRQTAANQIWDGPQPGFAVLSETRGISAAHYFLSLIANGWISFWGVFDGLSRWMPIGVYVVIASVQLLSAMGLIFLFFRGWARPPYRARVCGLLLTFTVFVCLVFFQYNWRHFTPQGRYFFVLLLPFGLGTSAGLRAVLCGNSRLRPLRDSATIILVGLLILLNVYALVTYTNRS